MEDPKRKLSELITQYKLSSKTNEIFVEGRDDENFFKNICFNDDYKRGIAIRSIEFIDFAEIDQDKLNLRKSNKNKLIYLSEKLEAVFDKKLKVSCIVDKDYDEIQNKIKDGFYLEYTDYSSIELYCFNPDCISKFINIYLREFKFDSKFILKKIENVLAEYSFAYLSILNCYSDKDKLPKRSINSDFFKINKKTGEIKFEKEKYYNKIFLEYGLKKFNINCKKEYNNLKRQYKKPYKNLVYGHHFIDLLYYYIDRIKNNHNVNKDGLLDLLFLCINQKKLIEEKLIKKIRMKHYS